MKNLRNYTSSWVPFAGALALFTCLATSSVFAQADCAKLTGAARTQCVHNEAAQRSANNPAGQTHVAPSKSTSPTAAAAPAATSPVLPKTASTPAAAAKPGTAAPPTSTAPATATVPAKPATPAASTPATATTPAADAKPAPYVSQYNCQPLSGADRSKCLHDDNVAHAAYNKQLHDADMVKIRAQTAANKKAHDDAMDKLRADDQATPKTTAAPTPH